MGNILKSKREQRTATPDVNNPGSGKKTWKSSKDINTAVHKFHDIHATQPDMKEAKADLTNILCGPQGLESKLREAGKCQKLEYTGGAYEGVKTKKDIEMDLMVVVDAKNLKAEKGSPRPGFKFLKPQPGKENDAQFKGCLDEQGRVAADKYLHQFHGDMQKAINRTPDIKDRTILRDHGPAVQMDVLKEDKVEYMVDMVPTLRTSDKSGKTEKSTYYVAKPSKNCSPVDMTSAWRTSKSLDEKEKLKNCDRRDNGCRKKCLRSLKVLTNKEPALKGKCTSYHLKTALYQEMEECPNKSWSQEHFGERLLDLNDRLGKQFAERKFPHHFLSNVSLVDGTSACTTTQMGQRFQNLGRSEHAFRKAIGAKKEVEKKKTPKPKTAEKSTKKKSTTCCALLCCWSTKDDKSKKTPTKVKKVKDAKLAAAKKAVTKRSTEKVKKTTKKAKAAKAQKRSSTNKAAKKTPTKKAPARKTPTKKTPTRKAPKRKTPTRKTPTSKAPTRKGGKK